MIIKIIFYFKIFFSFNLLLKIKSQLYNDHNHNNNNEGRIRLIGGRTMFEGNVEINHFNRWGSICDDEWDQLDADVVCKQLGFILGAIIPTNNSRYGKSNELIWMDNVMCFGNELNISSCLFDGWNIHDCDMNEAAGVICRTHLHQQPIYRKKFIKKKQPKIEIFLPDLEPDPKEVESSAYIEYKSLMYLQCAMEENCLSRSAYEIDKNDPTWIFNTRILLRFTASIKNIGKSDFRPFLNKNKWLWHSCHRHYHSMEIFATFDIINSNGEHVAQGHKASFCLEDNECDTLEIDTNNYVCANFGDQGISVNCVDIYKSDLDCQWIDITDLKSGQYYLKIKINPEMKVSEITYNNNAIICKFIYYDHQYLNNNLKNLSSSIIKNCTLTSL